MEGEVYKDWTIEGELAMHCRTRTVSLGCLGTWPEKRQTLMGNIFCVL